MALLRDEGRGGAPDGDQKLKKMNGLTLGRHGAVLTFVGGAIVFYRLVFWI